MVCNTVKILQTKLLLDRNSIKMKLSIIQLVLDASFVVQIVMAILILFSILSWGIILRKWIFLNKIKFSSHKFIKQFANTTNVATLYNEINALDNKFATHALFYNGINEYNKINKQGISDSNVVLSNVERTLTATIDTELDNYSQGLSTLATFGSVSPYIGLLGTVWGIMDAFSGLGSGDGQATLNSVAPGIAEALVATAIGLIVAIPAYIFYNKFTSDINTINNKMNKFGDDFLNLINRRLANNSNTHSDNF